jgi:quercetin dioxygenase-like cupin family protein
MQTMAQQHFHERKDRVFVRGIQGEYNLKEELRRLRAMPRVRRATEIDFIDGPQAFSRHYLHPEDNLGQTLHIHLEEYAPGGHAQMHFHVNEAIFYILDGKGFEIHDGERHEWEAGDAAIVPNHTVHMHNNADSGRPARLLVMKTKPMFIFMNMLFQRTVIRRPKKPSLTGAGFVPREED